MKLTKKVTNQNLTIKPELFQHYEQAGLDYAGWSKNLNMHFGYYKPWTNPFNREQMLEETSYQVFQRIGLDKGSCRQVLDLGCGVGASMRTGVACYPDKHFTGVTIVPWQISKAHELSVNTRNLKYHLSDYRQLPFPDHSFDACYGIESIIHASGEGKAQALAEMYRVLRPGGKFAVVDCFFKVPSESLSSFTRHCYEEMCRIWAVSEIAPIDWFIETAASIGFSNLQTEDTSLRVAPSVAHAPFAVLAHLLRQTLRGKHLSTKSLEHLKACLLTVIIGINRRAFSYFIVTGSK